MIRPLPYQVQEEIETEIGNLFNWGHLEEIQNVEEDSVFCPVSITVERDK